LALHACKPAQEPGRVIQEQARQRRHGRQCSPRAGGQPACTDGSAPAAGGEPTAPARASAPPLPNLSAPPCRPPPRNASSTPSPACR
jgi:hypothetical protein